MSTIFFAPRDCYQGSRLLEGWLIKAGIPSIEELMNKEEARREIIDSYLATGSISGVACLWQTSRNVVRKWVSMFKKDGKEGLKD